MIANISNTVATARPVPATGATGTAGIKQRPATAASSGHTATASRTALPTAAMMTGPVPRRGSLLDIQA